MQSSNSPIRMWAWLICLAVGVLAGCAAQPAPVADVSAVTSVPPKHRWTMAEVSDSYVFGYPLVVMASARAQASAPGFAGINTLHRASGLSASKDHPGRSEQAELDTLASFAWVDLTAEPMLLVLPVTQGDYLDARVLDMWTNVVWSTGSLASERTPQGGLKKASMIAFVAPGWDGTLPKGVERVQAPGKTLWLSVHIAAAGPRELAGARVLQQKVGLMPLSMFDAEDARRERFKHAKGTKGTEHSMAAEHAAAGRESTEDRIPPSFADTPAGQMVSVASLDAGAFFSRLADALKDNPPSPADPHALSILADLGVKPGEPANLPSDAADAIAAGLADGRTRIATAPDNALSAQGWVWLGDGVGHYGDDYLLRAYAAYTRPDSGTKDDEVIASASEDAQGQALDGSYRYVLHFPAGGLPPARGLWTLTAYTKDGALVEGRLPHRSIASRDAVRRNGDGSVDIYVQASSPGRARQSNWLPAPDGPFELVMRLYAPRPAVADGSWAPPALVRH